MATLVFFRIIASLGIGGEWAAGAAMVAEVVPEHRRVEAGAHPVYGGAARALSGDDRDLSSARCVLCRQP